MKAILLDEAKKWLEENCENLYTRMAVFGIMQSMPTVDYQEEPNEPLISGFDVIDTKTGEYPDLWEIALKEDWANGLMYCDMEGFAIEISIHTTLAGGDSKNGREIHPFSITIKA